MLTFQKNVCITRRKQTSVSCAADCGAIVCYGAAKLADKHLASKVHCVDDEIVGWLKRREQASFSYFGESAKITAALRRGSAAR
jgi:hypothetical protein